jgi:undecaprenyl-diphosphatase
MTSLNETFFSFLHALAGESLMFDMLVVFSAQFLVLWMVFAVLAVIAVFVYVEEFRDETQRRTERRWARFARHAFFSLFAGVAAWAFAETIKYLSPSPRPFIELSTITPLFTHGALDSFPSGHAAFSFALASYLFFHHKILGGVLLVGALIVSLSRVIVGIHWPLDILVGAILGVLVALIVWFIVTRFSATISGYND